MALDEIKAVARRVIDDVVNKGDLSVVDEIFSPDFVEHDPAPGHPPTLEGVLAFVSNFRRAFPDVHVNIEDVIAEADRVVERVTVRATMTGDYAGMPASGRTAVWPQIHISRVVNGKIVEHWTVGDQLGMLVQLGFGPGR
jgi:steroid delta-isomerase-like uncharacterized protein